MTGGDLRPRIIGESPTPTVTRLAIASRWNLPNASSRCSDNARDVDDNKRDDVDGSDHTVRVCAFRHEENSRTENQRRDRGQNVSGRKGLLPIHGGHQITPAMLRPPSRCALIPGLERCQAALSARELGSGGRDPMRRSERLDRSQPTSTGMGLAPP